MDLRTYALTLKKELQATPTTEKAKEIAYKIATVKHSDGTPVTDKEREHILNYLEYDVYNHVTGEKGIFSSDNSDFLKLVAVIAKNTTEK